MRGRGRGRDPWGMMLMLQLAQRIQQLEYKPPATLGTIVILILIHFGVAPVPSLDKMALTPILFFRESIASTLRRLIGSTVLHVNDTHLGYNLLSFLWKGHQLEREHGSNKFALLLLVLSFLSSGSTVGLAYIASLFGYHEWLHERSVGFSGVLFALKVLLTYESVGDSFVHGFVVPTKYACWVEVLVVYLLQPYTSLPGHLGGVVAGVLVAWALRHGGALVKNLRTRARTARATHSSQGGRGGGVPLGHGSNRRRPESDFEMASRLQREENRRFNR